MRRRILAALLCAVVFQASALDVPQGAAADGRVKQVAYNEHDVVAIYSFPGIATQVELDAGETVADMATGFSDGWELIDRRNVIYIKPKSVKVESQAGEAWIEPEPGKWDTNMIVQTDRRTYVFQLFLIGSRSDSKKLEYDPRMAFRVKFTYPQAVAAQAAQAQARAVAAQRLDATNAVKNLNYTMKVARKSSAIAPSAAYDDGRFTYLQFPPNGELPNVYLVDQDKAESLVNTHMAGDTLVVHRVAPKLMLRLGKQAVAIFNEAYDQVGTSLVSTGTTVPGVQRVLTVMDQNDAPSLPPMVAQAQGAMLAAAAAPAPAAVPQAATTPAAPVAPPAPALTAEPIERVRISAPPLVLDRVAAAPVQMPKIDTAQLVAPSEPWVATAGGPSLRGVLEAWGRRNGWSVYFDTQDYYVDADFQSDGTFLEAVQSLLTRYQNAEVPVVACAFTKPATPVLYLTRSYECKSPRR